MNISLTKILYILLKTALWLSIKFISNSRNILILKSKSIILNTYLTEENIGNSILCLSLSLFICYSLALVSQFFRVPFYKCSTRSYAWTYPSTQHCTLSLRVPYLAHSLTISLFSPSLWQKHTTMCRWYVHDWRTDCLLNTPHLCPVSVQFLGECPYFNRVFFQTHI